MCQWNTWIIEWVCSSNCAWSLLKISAGLMTSVVRSLMMHCKTDKCTFPHYICYWREVRLTLRIRQCDVTHSCLYPLKFTTVCSLPQPLDKNNCSYLIHPCTTILQAYSCQMHTNIIHNNYRLFNNVTLNNRNWHTHTH